jgi:hypothetical protein
VNLDNALDYVEFVEERHRIWERRQAGEPGPWTTHPILASRKFTNVFRVLDYGSQFLLRELLEPELSERDTLMRCFLYRHTGRPESWEYLGLSVGYPTVADLEDVRAAWHVYRGGFKEGGRGSGARFQAKTGGVRVFDNPMFTSAYLVFPQSATPGTDKLDSIIDLTKRLFTPGSPEDIVPEFLAASSQRARFAVLRRNKGVGDFMSMQVLTDWGYSSHCPTYREDEFVTLGPGAVRGAAALGAGIETAVDLVRSSVGCPQLAGRPPSYMDIQNTLCEFSKWVRYRDKTGPGEPYVPAHPGKQPEPALPVNYERIDR